MSSSIYLLPDHPHPSPYLFYPSVGSVRRQEMVVTEGVLLLLWYFLFIYFFNGGRGFSSK